MNPMRRLMFVQGLALLWLVVMGAILVAREPPTATLTGKVVAKETGQPIPKAVIEARGENYGWADRVETDSQGVFTLRGVPAGKALLQAFAKVHRMDREQEVTLREGTGNMVTLVAPPVEPFLELAMPQHVYTPEETPKITCTGYTAGDMLGVAIRRVSWTALRNAQESPATPYDEGLRVPPSVGEVVYDEQIAAAPKDVEGALRCKLPVQALPPGIYSLWVTGADAKIGAVFSVSRLGLVTKITKRTLLAYVVDLTDGRPVPDAQVTYFRGPSEVLTGRTDADGLFRTALPPGQQGTGRVVAAAGDSVAFTRAEAYSYDPERPIRIYFYTDRPIYRPGHTVHYKGIVRQREGSGYRVLAGLPIRLQIRSPNGALLSRKTVKTNEYGSFHGDFSLSPEAAIGQYTVETAAGGRLASSSEEGGEETVSEASFSFNVAEYRKPEYLVEVTTEPGPDAGVGRPTRRQYVRGDPVRVTVTATYFWGAPVKGATVEYRVSRQPYWYAGEEEDEFAGYYARQTEDVESGEPTVSGRMRTDDNGRVSFTFETALPQPENQDHVYVIEAEVTDPGRMPVTGTGRAIVSRGTFRLQLEPGRWIASPGQTFPLRVKTVNFDGTPRPNVPVTLTIRKQLAHVTTDAKGVASLDIPADRPGSLEVEAAVVDERGNRMTENTWLWVAEGDEGVSDPSFNYAELELVADKKLYQPGDTAKVMVLTSRPGDTALVTLEGLELYTARVVRLAANATPIEIPIERAYQPNVYLSVTTVRGKTYRNRDLQLKVSPQEHALTVQVTADRERYGPRQQAVYTIRTLDLQGRPVAAEASLGLVDESIYAIMPDSPLGGLQAFYGIQENRVSTSFSFPEIYLASDKEGGPEQVRRDFPDTASWFPIIRTGPDGRATVRVRLPDTLTTWRATVRAHTLATQVGTGIAKVISTKPLLVRLETPRFFAQNDETLISAVVHNDTDSPQRVTVTLKADPLQLRDAPAATFDVPARGSERKDWRATAGAGREATLLVSARAASGLNDAVELKRPIVPHGAEQRDGASGEVAGETTTARLALPAGAIRPATVCRVTLTGSPSGVMLSALDYLDARDYGTSENAVGWFLPAMTVAMALRDVGVLGKPGQGDGRLPAANADPNDPIQRLAAELPRRVRDNVERLYQLQSYDGGWGWAGTSESDAFWTAYVLYGLDQARRAGYLVDAGVIERGTEALRQRWPKVTDDSNRALTLYVLQRVERPVRPATRQALLRMAERAPKLQNYARALVALALADLGETAAARSILPSLHAGCKEKGDETWWPEIFPWGFYSCNNNETTGYALMALIRLDPTHPRIERAARWLMRHREGDAWTSTEDTASVIYALSAYMRHVARTRPPDCVVTVRVNGQVAGRQQITRRNMFRPLALSIDPALLREGENEVALEKSGSGTPLYSAFLRTYVGREGLTAASSGFSVRRAYFRRMQERDVHGRWQERDIPLTGVLRPGDEVVVKVTVKTPRACREVVIRDPLPAGCEGLDALTDFSEGDYYSGDARREVRDRDVTFYAGFLRPGANEFEYRYRAQIPGDYHVMPAQAACAYIPEIWGATGEDRVAVRE
jgi:uncharacterized protein YfaS (alpha-2-macroglobulin family)